MAKRPKSGGFVTGDKLQELLKETRSASIIEECLVHRLIDGSALRTCNPMGGPMWAQWFSPEDANERFNEPTDE